MKKQILIIDDEWNICETLKLALLDICDVEYVIDTKSALTYILEHKEPSLIILDYQIDGKDGIQFYIDEIKPIYKQTPTILISGYIGQHKSAELEYKIKKYFVTNLEKPFDLNAIREEVQSYL